MKLNGGSKGRSGATRSGQALASPAIGGPVRFRRPSSPFGSRFHRRRVSRTRRTAMGVRVVVGEREPIGVALRRLKKQAERAGVPRELRMHAEFVGGTEQRRAKRFRKRFKAREAALVAKMAAGLSGPALDAAKAEFWRRTGKP